MHGNAIPDEQLTIRLTPRKKAPMPGDAAALEAFVNTADCTRSNGLYDHRHIPGDIRLHGPWYL